MDTTTISELSNKTPTGNMFTVIEDGGSTGKTTIDDFVAAAEIIGKSNMGTTAQTITGAIAEHENDISEMRQTISEHADDIQSNANAIGDLSGLNTVAQGSIVSAINEVDTNADQLNNKNYTVISSGQTIDVLTYARSLGRGQHNVYCAASTATGGPTTDACLYEFFVQGNGLVYIRATRWTSTAANRNVWDAIVNTSTSSIAWRQMPSRAEIDSLNSNLENNMHLRKTISGSILSTDLSPGAYYVVNGTDTPSGVTGAGFLTIDERSGYSSIRRVIFSPYNGNNIYINTRVVNGTGWNGWKALSLTTV